LHFYVQKSAGTATGNWSVTGEMQTVTQSPLHETDGLSSSHTGRYSTNDGDKISLRCYSNVRLKIVLHREHTAFRNQQNVKRPQFYAISKLSDK